MFYTDLHNFVTIFISAFLSLLLTGRSVTRKQRACGVGGANIVAKAWNLTFNVAAICLFCEIVQLSLIKFNYYRLVSLFGDWRRAYRIDWAAPVARVRARSAAPAILRGRSARSTRNLRAALGVFRQARCVCDQPWQPHAVT